MSSTTSQVKGLCGGVIKVDTSKQDDVPMQGLFVSHAVMASSNVLWESGTVLSYSFFGGTPLQRKKVVDVMVEWTWYAHITFKQLPENDPSAIIRITFDPKKGSWSYVGNLAKTCVAPAPTMNFGWIDDDDSISKKERGVILHEFGHVLGLMHEHESPARSGIIRLKEREIIQYYREKQGWDEAMVRSQVLDVYTKESVSNYSKFDPTSIMMYFMPGSMNEGGVDIHETTELSMFDKAFIVANYPRPEPHPSAPEWTPKYALTVAKVSAETLEAYNHTSDVDEKRDIFTQDIIESRELESQRHQIRINEQKAPKVPVQNAPNVSVQNAINAPVQNALNTPVQNAINAPVQNALNVPVQNALNTPVQNAINAPVQNAINTPVQNALNTPVQNALNVPVQNALNTPVQNTLNVPVQNAPNTPVQNALNVPVQNALNTPVQNALNAPVQNAPNAPVQNAPNVPVENAPNVQAGFNTSFKSTPPSDDEFIRNIISQLDSVGPKKTVAKTGGAQYRPNAPVHAEMVQNGIIELLFKIAPMVLLAPNIPIAPGSPHVAHALLDPRSLKLEDPLVQHGLRNFFTQLASNDIVKKVMAGAVKAVGNVASEVVGGLFPQRAFDSSESSSSLETSDIQNGLLTDGLSILVKKVLGHKMFQDTIKEISGLAAQHSANVSSNSNYSLSYGGIQDTIQSAAHAEKVQNSIFSLLLDIAPKVLLTPNAPTFGSSEVAHAVLDPNNLSLEHPVVQHGLFNFFTKLASNDVVKKVMSGAVQAAKLAGNLASAALDDLLPQHALNKNILNPQNGLFTDKVARLVKSIVTHSSFREALQNIKSVVIQNAPYHDSLYGPSSDGEVAFRRRVHDSLSEIMRRGGPQTGEHILRRIEHVMASSSSPHN